VLAFARSAAAGMSAGRPRLFSRMIRQRLLSRARCTVASSARRAYVGAARIPTAARAAADLVLKVPASILLLIVSITLPILTFAAAFTVSNRTAEETQIWARKGYFLSAAIDLPPAANFGSLGLTVTLAAFVAVAVVRHHIVAERLGEIASRDRDFLAWMHSLSLASAITAALGGHGVAAYQHAESQFWHNSFAACFILCALLHFSFESRIECLAGLSSRRTRIARFSLVSLSTASCATFISHVLIEEMGKTPIGIGKLAAASAEIVTCLCFLAYLATYSRSFHETRITLRVQYMPSGVSTANSSCASLPRVAAGASGAAVKSRAPLQRSKRMYKREAPLIAAPKATN